DKVKLIDEIKKGAEVTQLASRSTKITFSKLSDKVKLIDEIKKGAEVTQLATKYGVSKAIINTTWSVGTWNIDGASCLRQRETCSERGSDY
ncbi:hypothetical protein QE152_g1794, partial [Popillia japonica]